jgi:tryptophan synthase alpha chain
MSYWNPIERYGLDSFAADFHAAGGVGVITPDLTPEEAEDWIEATNSNNVDRVFLIALSSSDERIAKVANVTTGFIYAGAVMGVTGARSSISDAIEGLVAKARRHSDLPIAVGLGVSTPEQAHEIAQYADGVIVGSAFVTAIKNDGAAGAKELAQALSKGLAR